MEGRSGEDVLRDCILPLELESTKEFPCKGPSSRENDKCHSIRVLEQLDCKGAGGGGAGNGDRRTSYRLLQPSKLEIRTWTNTVTVNVGGGKENQLMIQLGDRNNKIIVKRRIQDSYYNCSSCLRDDMLIIARHLSRVVTCCFTSKTGNVWSPQFGSEVSSN